MWRAGRSVPCEAESPSRDGVCCVAMAAVSGTVQGMAPFSAEILEKRSKGSAAWREFGAKGGVGAGGEGGGEGNSGSAAVVVHESTFAIQSTVASTAAELAGVYLRRASRGTQRVLRSCKICRIQMRQRGSPPEYSKHVHQPTCLTNSPRPMQVPLAPRLVPHPETPRGQTGHPINRASENHPVWYIKLRHCPSTQ